MIDTTTIQRWIIARPIAEFDIPERSAVEPFMMYSTCSATDFFHPQFRHLSEMLSIPAVYHRKYWEWVFIIHTAMRMGVTGPGFRSLGYGVGTEPLPAALAKLGGQVTATDAPAEIGIGNGWSAGGEYADGAERLRYEGILDQKTFLSRVDFREMDMNHISDDLRGYDFVWSSCCLEHLGTLQHGLDFIINTVEKNLKPGGVACHTTEFNLVSNEATVESGQTVLYRMRDLEWLAKELRRRGHEVDNIVVAPDSHVLDRYVDIPPYSPNGHLKLMLEGYPATSIGLVIRRRKSRAARLIPKLW